MRFGADIVVDHVGYRRYGHWVGDDPTMTRPAVQRRIDAHPAVAKLYAAALARRGVADEREAQRLEAAALKALETARMHPTRTDPSDSGGDPRRERSHAAPIHTAVPIDRLRALAGRLADQPEGFTAHPAVERMREDWWAVAKGDDRPVDWRLAENLAYATLLANGFNVRLTGLDVGRGSFCHRQHVWHDQRAHVDGRDIHVPLRGVADGQGGFSIFESPLSEEAVLGFEYGYSLACGRDLVVWEGQFGDFVNNAQVIIDQFIASGEAKWSYESGLAMLLPHGDDGLGPEHSNACLGRFLQLCAEGNIEVAIPSTSAQFYHLLRRQALRGKRKPLIVMTPKPWLYGHAPSYSRLADLAGDEFRPLLVESDPIDAAAVHRAVVVSGKFYYSLATERARAASRNLPVLRAEALYPFPAAELEQELARFPRLAQVVWAQEEAQNHGAWYLVRESLESALPAGASLLYAGRPSRAAAASAAAAGHAAEQERIARGALGLDA
jgi:2-oxoglutarate dehydrogenase E1 component